MSGRSTSGRSLEATVEDVVEPLSAVVNGMEDEMNDRLQLDAALREAGVVAEASGLSMAKWLKGMDPEESGSSSGRTSEEAEANMISSAVNLVSDYAMRVQRLLAMRTVKMYAHGRFPRTAAFWGVPEIPAARPRDMGALMVTSLEDGGGIYERLRRRERVVAQVVARTAIGKTTRFPSEIAMRAQVRVLQLEPDMVLAKLAKSAQSHTGIVVRPGSAQRSARLTVMTFPEFAGRLTGMDGLRMMAQYDVFYYDEAHFTSADLDVIRIVVATRAPPTLSIIAATATPLGGEGTAQATGRPRDIAYTSKTMTELVDEGKLLTGKYCQDRTMLIVPDDEAVDRIASKVSASGLHVRRLDSASTAADIMSVQEFFRDADSAVNRYVVTSNEYGTGTNLSVGLVVTEGKRVARNLSADRRSIETSLVRVDKTELAQHAGRVARGLVDKAMVLVCGMEDEFPDEPILDDEHFMRQYVLLKAARVRPLPELELRVAKFFPFGITEETAKALLSTRLPVIVAIRYFTKTGTVPYRYAKALEVFADDGFRFSATQEEEPYGIETWHTEAVGAYYGAAPVQGAFTVKVPVLVTGDLQVVVHAIELMAQGLVRLDHWMPSSGDDEMSGDEGDAPRSPVGTSYVPRMVLDEPVARVVTQPVLTYSYTSALGMPRTRLAIDPVSLPEGISAALARADMDTTLEEFVVRCGIAERLDDRGRTRVEVLSTSTTPVEVVSPGGTAVASFRKDVWFKLAAGEAVTGELALSFFRSVRANIAGFAASDAFSGWTPVWDGVLNTLSHPENISHIMRAKLYDRVGTLLLKLVERYSKAVSAVASGSYVFAGFFEMLVRTQRSYEEIFDRQARSGRTQLAQSEKFLRRVTRVREMLVNTVFELEASEIFLPSVVTQLQQMLPVLEKTGNRTIDKPLSKRHVFRLVMNR